VQLTRQWLALDPTVRAQIKSMVETPHFPLVFISLSFFRLSAHFQRLIQRLQNLQPRSAPFSTPINHQQFAQLVARIGVCEIPANQWPELIGDLLKNMKSPDENVKAATLQCLGYLCQDMVCFFMVKSAV